MRKVHFNIFVWMDCFIHMGPSRISLDIVGETLTETFDAFVRVKFGHPRCS